MGQEDKLKKQIDELARVLGKVLTYLINRNAGAVSDPMESISQQVNEEIDLDLKKLMVVPVEELIKTITSETSLKKEHLEILADIFFQGGKSHISLGQEEKGKELYRKSIILLQYLTSIDKTYDKGREDKITTTEKLL